MFDNKLPSYHCQRILRTLARPYVLMGLLCLGVLSAPSQAFEQATETRTLENGLEVVVHVDQRAPIVVQQLWYSIGSSNEHIGQTGLSHMLEHMLFKATDQYASGEFSAQIAARGGSENAFTSRDYTAYFQTLSNADLDWVMGMEAARMRGIVFNQAEFDKELSVVQEERRSRTDDSPAARLYEQFLSVAFLNSPSRLPIIGWPEDLASMQLDDLIPWYNRWYHPNNAVLVIAGDVELDQVFELAQKHYGPIPKAAIKPSRPRTEIPQRGERRLSLKDPRVQVPLLIMGYKVPSFVTAEDKREAYALSMLSGVLDGGDSARFAKHLLREQQLVSYAGASYSLYDPRPTLFTLQATPLADASVDELEQALIAQIEQIATEGVSEQELSRVRAQVISGKVFEQDSLFRKAMLIGETRSKGLPLSSISDYTKALGEVTSEQVQAVAKKYFSRDQLTVATLLPSAPESVPSQPQSQSPTESQP